MKTIFFENLQFIVLGLLIVAQCVVGGNWYFGQYCYLVANILAVIRSFVLVRPVADKVKDSACLAITIGLILFKILGV